MAGGGAAPQAGATSRGGSDGGTAPQAGNGGAGGGIAGQSSSGGGDSLGGDAGAGGGNLGGGAGAGGAPAATCPATVLKPGDTSQTLMLDGRSRSYTLHVPASYDGMKPVPLVVDFHPLGGSGPSERASSPYPAQTDAEGVIMAFPSGLSGPSGGAWNVGPCCVKDVDDVAFAKALVAKIEESACIDPQRVYAVGFSMGGGMSHYLACHAADVFAAVAPAAFDLLEENVGDCKPARPISVVSFRGNSDPIVPYAGGGSSVVQGMPVTFLGAKNTFAKWAELNQCAGAASAEDAQGCAKYSGCAGNVDVVLCTQPGGGHAAGNTSIAWPILKKHTLP